MALGSAPHPAGTSPCGRLLSYPSTPASNVRTDRYLSLRRQLQDLRARIQQKQLSAEELLTVVACLEAIIEGLELDRDETAGWMKRLENDQRDLNVHIVAIEDSLIFRWLRRMGRPLLEWKAKWMHHSPFQAHRRADDDRYGLWIQQQEDATPGLAWYRGTAEEFRGRPLLSLTLPVRNPRREWLEQAVQSVLDQTYSHWELCVCHHGSSDDWVREYFASLAGADARFRIVHSAEALGSAEALKQSCSLAKGDYFIFLNQDSVVSRLALHHVVEALQDEPADLIYTDEDRLDADGRRVDPVFKPDWSPDLLLSCPYVGHLMVLSREALERSGGVRPGFDGAEDYDLVLRLADHPAAVRHIPLVLYHGRAPTEPAAGGPSSSRPDTYATGRLAVEDTVRRRSWNAKVEDGPVPGSYRIRWNPLDQPLVSIIICSRSPKLLNQCLRAIGRRTDYSRRQIIVVQHVVDGINKDAMEAVVSRYGGRNVPYEGPFHFARMNNLGAGSAEGEILVFLNDDVEPLVSSWLCDLAAQAQRPEIGVVGARLLYPSGTLQHAGIATGIGDGCGHPGRGSYGSAYWKWLDLTRNVSAVTGACLAIRKHLFQQLGGFDQRFPVNYNDADLCLRAIKAGFRVVYESAAVLRHYECQTRRGGVSFSERDQWYSCWSDELDRGDPFYNPNLSRVREDASLRLEA